MSDPVTNVEIEDVLTSIRRLVSVEDREKSAEREQGASGETPPRHQDEDKLVLTPSLRVDETSSYRDGVSAPASARDDEAGDGAQAFPPHDAPEDADPAGEADADASGLSGPERRAAELRARVAEFEALVAARADQWEPDGEAPDANAGAKGEPLPWEDCRPDDVGTGVAGDAAPADTEEWATASGDAGDGLSDPADPEAAEFEAADPGAFPDDGIEDEEPEAPGMDDAMTGPDADAPEAGDDDLPEDDDLSGDYLTISEQTMDEEALRDLVTEIVRQELQGALGERITRNVRKLVRREIHRALAAQDLD